MSSPGSNAGFGILGCGNSSTKLRYKHYLNVRNTNIKQSVQKTFWIGGRRLVSLYTFSQSSICISTHVATMAWVRRMYSSETPPSTQTLSMNRPMNFFTDVPDSTHVSWSSKPDSPPRLSLSAMLEGKINNIHNIGLMYKGPNDLHINHI